MSMALGAIGGVECENSVVSKRGSKLDNTAELACVWFRGLIGTPGAVLLDPGASGIDVVLSNGTFPLGRGSDV